MSTAPGSLTFVFRFQDYFNLSATRSPLNRKLSGSEPLTPQAVILADVFTSEVLQPKRQLINHGAEGTGSPLCVAVSGKRSDFSAKPIPTGTRGTGATAKRARGRTLAFPPGLPSALPSAAVPALLRVRDFWMLNLALGASRLISGLAGGQRERIPAVPCPRAVR